PVVGVGASAGGLEAVTQLLQSVPGEPGLALLLAMHLHPDFKSELPEILSRVSPIPVRQAGDGMRVEMNHVYIIPPSQSIALTDGHISLTPRPPRGLYMPADHLFRSLAALHKTRAIGVILSGDGTDGTLGFQSPTAERGITFAQSENAAKPHGMPRSAIADGCVDYVLPPPMIARELLRLTRHPYTAAVPVPEQALAEDEHFGQIIAMLRS